MKQRQRQRVCFLETHWPRFSSRRRAGSLKRRRQRKIVSALLALARDWKRAVLTYEREADAKTWRHFLSFTRYPSFRSFKIEFAKIKTLESCGKVGTVPGLPTDATSGVKVTRTTTARFGVRGWSDQLPSSVLNTLIKRRMLRHFDFRSHVITSKFEFRSDLNDIIFHPQI